MISVDELRLIMPRAHERADMFCQPLNDAMAKFYIDNAMRECAFIAQVAHESGELLYVRELASGEAYEGRADLGNTQPGDGKRFLGRGLIQITGRANYIECGDALAVDLLADPDILETPALAASSAAWFWQRHGLNGLADKPDFLLITKRINGGTNGYPQRLGYYAKAKSVMGIV